MVTKSTFENIFYKERQNLPGVIRGFPSRIGPWCNSRLKVKGLTEAAHTICGGGGTSPVQYLGIAADEPERLARLDGVTKISPLEAIGWTEQDCMKWCRENDLVSPIYTTASRGGCWFCHNQGVDQLRLLRKNYPELWALLLKWDNDSPVTFHSDGRTVHDFEKRFMLEDLRKIPTGKPFRWKMLEDHEDESVFIVPKIEL